MRAIAFGRKWFIVIYSDLKLEIHMSKLCVTFHVVPTWVSCCQDKSQHNSKFINCLPFHFYHTFIYLTFIAHFRSFCSTNIIVTWFFSSCFMSKISWHLIKCVSLKYIFLITISYDTSFRNTFDGYIGRLHVKPIHYL